MMKNISVLYLVLLMLDLVQSVQRNNKAYNGASLVKPWLYKMAAQGNATLASATDGVMTRWEPDAYVYWPGYNFRSGNSPPGDAYL